MTAADAYRAFGLTFASPIRLWMAPCAGEQVDVTIEDRTGQVGWWEQGGTDDGTRTLEFRDVAKIRVSHGRRIEIGLTGSDDPSVFRFLAAGTALGLLFHQRGDIVLHGSAIDVDGQGVVLLGASGAGKSTLAAALCSRGHNLISDGMSVLRMTEQGCVALPGPPFVKLWPDAVELLGGDVENLPKMLPDLAKRIMAVRQADDPKPICVSALYALHAGEPEGLEQLSAAQGVWELIRNHYLTDFLGSNVAPAMLEMSAAVARQARVNGFGRPIDVSRVVEAAKVLETNVT